MLHYNKATVCERRGYHEEALEAINEAIEYYDKDPNFHYMRGNIFYQMQMLDQAHENYDEAIRMEPNNDRFWHQKGLAYQQSGSKDNVSEAIRMFKQALELNEKCVAARFHLGIMYHQNNNFHEALQCFTQVFEDEKNNPDLFIK